MLDRLDVMEAKGCDAVEWDNADLPIHDVSYFCFTRLQFPQLRRHLECLHHWELLGVMCYAYLLSAIDTIAYGGCLLQKSSSLEWPAQR